MQNSKVKNSIVLRGMASNVVDEAIVILKPNIRIKNMERLKNPKVKEKNNSKEFIIKEAENVITEYVNRISEKNSRNRIKEMESKIKILKIINAMFLIILLATIFLEMNRF